MTDSEKPEFDQTMRGLALGVQLRLNLDGEKWTEMLRVYWDDLRDIPLGALREACRTIRTAGASFPSSGALRASCREYQTEATRAGCGRCQAGLINATWWSPIYNANVSGMTFCECPLGQRKSERAGSKVPDRRMA